MRSIFLQVLLSLLIFHSLNVHASNNLRNKASMSLCSINHIDIPPAIGAVSLLRDNAEEESRYTKDVNGAISLWEYKIQKESEIRQNIRDLYASRIMNTIGISTADIAPNNSFSGTLSIEVNINDSGVKTSSGESRYVVSHDVTLYEDGLSRYGRVGELFLHSWSEKGYAETLSRADIEAINLVSKVVRNIEETFKREKEYCTKNKLFNHKQLW